MTAPQTSSPYPNASDPAFVGYQDSGFTGRVAVRRDAIDSIRPADEIIYPADGSEPYISFRIVGSLVGGATIYLAGFSTATERDTYWSEHVTDWLVGG